MKWLLKKDDLGYVLYEGKQILRRAKRKGAYSRRVDYEFCVSNERLALSLLERQLKKSEYKITLSVKGLSREAVQKLDLIIKEHNK